MNTDLLLLCIDAQPALVNALPNGARALRRCEFAIRAARLLEIPALFTEQVPAKLGPTAPELIAAAGDKPPTFAKNTFSALADDSIRAVIKNHAHLLLCGFETPICVYQTAIDALRENIHVTLLTDAIAARRDEDARACLAELARAGAHLLPSETIFYSLLHDSAHPQFKAHTQLVKNFA